MVEYIAKNLAIELMHQSSYLSDGDLLEVNGNLAKARIEAEPAADVVPVVHAIWSYRGNHRSGLKVCECSNCNRRAFGSTDYCPNCGAKMDEGEDHEAD